MLPDVELHLRDRVWGEGEVAVAAVAPPEQPDLLTWATRAAAAGADLLDLGAVPPQWIRPVRDRLSDTAILAGPGEAAALVASGVDAVRAVDPGVPGPGHVVVCPTPPAPRPRAGVLVDVDADPRRLAALAEAGWPVIAYADDPDTGGGDAELAGVLARAAVFAWLGTRVVATRHVAAVRQAVDMVATIRGTRPPAAVRRGLA